ncbi:hypothetical protein [Umboniibacter marinipuniceus]|uniref:Uncharacterized protein n=1 Tax=Umboniibacter marinipuniceus TaxID=569599 RepID=A0A3L9ZYT2_9GAMM|nr:hypothetical protein [Umboniibacter marinipuniceus]RMA77610.1 hypothetical protein DFR27_2429 [Umboniibacter marinipuniceus]
MTAPKWLLPVAIVAILWNLMGLFAFVIDLMITPELIAALPEADQAIYEARPGWMIIGTALAVVGGTLGSVGLAMKKLWSVKLFVASLVGLVIQDVALVLIAMEVNLAMAVIIMQSVVAIVAIDLWFIARKGSKKGWLV